MQLRIGFVGQGFIGKNYADDFEFRGYEVVRYALETPYRDNKEKVADCDMVFIAVPTPTTPEGFDLSIVESAIPLTKKGATVVIKSTLLPGSTDALYKKFPDRFVVHSPEFLRESNAAYDAAHPERNIVGIPEETPEFKERAEAVLAALPRAPFERVTSARAAELVKYAGNNFLYLKVVYANLLHDLAEAQGVSYEEVVEMLAADPRVGPSHLKVWHPSGHTDKLGRGAGGHCFIKDFEAFRRLYESSVHDPLGDAVLTALGSKNNALLRESGKDLDLLESVYGSRV